MGLFSSKKKNIKYVLCAIDDFTNYVWFKTFKNKKSKTVLNTFIEIANESNRKPNKLWVDQGRDFYNKFMQEWLDNNDILIYSTHNEDKSVIAKMFVKTLKSKIYRNMTANDSKSYLIYLNKLIDQYNNAYHHSVNKKSINDDYSALTERLGQEKYLLSILF